jgi:precorrin-2 dehydrogenase/sirohydrochlorin ferrochelatase
MLPIFLNVTNRLCVVIGGGPVGRRKARALLEAGADVRLICLEQPTAPEPRLEWITEPFRPEHLGGACVVVAAATLEVNKQVIAEARRRGVWVNSAYDPAAGDFSLPSVIRRGDFTLAIGTMGAAPGLSRNVRRRLEQEFDDAFGAWVRILGELRPHVLAAVPSEERRRELFAALSDWSWLTRMREEGEDAVRKAMQEEVRRRTQGLIE